MIEELQLEQQAERSGMGTRNTGPTRSEVVPRRVEDLGLAWRHQLDDDRTVVGLLT